MEGRDVTGVAEAVGDGVGVGVLAVGAAQPATASPKTKIITSRKAATLVIGSLVPIIYYLYTIECKVSVKYQPLLV